MVTHFSKSRRTSGLLIIGTLLLINVLLSHDIATASNSGVAIQITIDGAIGPATSDYVERALATAAEQRVELVVIRMDTPGGLDSSMRDIIKAISGSTVPVVSYVSPTGARAASAGTYIMYASHIAAMAPGTNLGAATPVSLGGISPGDGEDRKKKPVKEEPVKEKDSSQETPKVPDNKQAMRNKVVNDAVAYIRGLAELHGRNQEWAEKAVREGASLQATEALKLNVIDVVATGMVDLLNKIDGREVILQGRKHKIQTSGLTLELREMDWRSRLLSVLTDPNVAYILLLIGIYGLIFEFANPGAIVPGTVGAICLLLALYSLQLLPINYAGMGLILLGVALMVAEAYEPSFGILGIGGIISFAIGSIILMDTDVPGFGINISIIITFTLISALMFIFVVGMAIKARRRPVVSGMEQLIGSEAIALEDFNRKGQVTIHSETWQAKTDTPLQKDQVVDVVGIKGLTLQVKPKGMSESKTEEKSS